MLIGRKQRVLQRTSSLLILSPDMRTPPAFLLAFFLTALVTVSKGSGKTDSLLNAARHQTDTALAFTLNELCFNLAYTDVEKAKQYGFEALALSRKIGYKKGEMKAYTRIGIVYDIASDFDSAIWYYDKALVLAVAQNDWKLQASALNNKAMVFSNRGMYTKAMVMYLNALRLFERMNDTTGTANAMNNIAVLYNDMHKPNQSIRYSRQAVEKYRQSGNLRGMAAAYTNMAMSFEDTNLDSAYKYLRLSIELKEVLNDRFGLGISYNDLCLFFNSTEQPDSAIIYGKRAIAMRKGLNDQFGTASCLINLANAYGQKKQFDLQKASLDQAFDIAWALKSKRLLSRITFGLSSVYRQKGNADKAYRYLRWHGDFRDSLINEENTRNLNELEARYQSEKKDLTIANAQLALQAAEATLGRKRAQLTTLISVFILFAVSVLLVYVIYSGRQRRKRAQQKIEEEQLRNRAVISAEDEERKRIAKDLHDGVGQQLSAVKMNLSAYASDRRPNDLDEIIKMLDDTIREVRSVSHSMMPNALLHAGLASALRDFLNGVSSGGRLEVDLQIIGLRDRLDNKQETTLFRIIQECVANAIKHAEAGRLTVQIIHHPEHLTLMIEDDGKGFDPSTVRYGLGIRNIESRVAYINGRLDIDSQPGRGTTVTVEIPH